MAILEKHDWPGNVRELQSVIRYAMVQSVSDVLLPESLPNSLTNGSSRSGELVEFDLSAFVREQLEAGSPEIYRRVLHAVDQLVLELVLAHVKGNQVQASEVLGISRTTLRAKMQALGLRLEKQVLTDG